MCIFSIDDILYFVKSNSGLTMNYKQKADEIKRKMEILSINNKYFLFNKSCYRLNSMSICLDKSLLG